MCIGANGRECASVANLTQLKYLQLFHTDPLPVLNSLCDRRDALEDLVISTFKVSVCLIAKPHMYVCLILQCNYSIVNVQFIS